MGILKGFLKFNLA